MKNFHPTGNCPIRDILCRLGDKWSMLVMVTLNANGTMRFSDIQKTISDISQRMLTVTLRTLETDGQLFLDGRDVNDLSIRSVRDACAYVPQDNFLFSDTIENNIAFGKSETVSEEIRRAAKLADIDGNISEFQMGYQTVLGERGVTVSGGQKQRISIARALMKDAPILILDDSVSAVDTKTEKAILDNLRATRAGKTTILIAHRISTIEQMDKILFIEDGRLAGFDTHDKLYTENPAYRKMVDLQRLEEEGGAVNA